MSNVKMYVSGLGFRPNDKQAVDISLVPLSKNNLSNYTFQNISLDPIFGIPMLTPEQLTGLYNTQTTGTMARLRKTDFTLTDANWEEVETQFSGNWFLLSKNNTNEVIETNFNLEENRAILLRFTIFPSYNQYEALLSIWFGQYRLSIFSDSKTILYDGSGNALDSGYISGGYDKQKQYTNHINNITGQVVTLVILPIRRNTVEIFSSLGGGWYYEDTSLSTAVLGTITSSAKLKLQFPSSKGHIQVIPITYPATGTIGLYGVIANEMSGSPLTSSNYDSSSDCSIDLDTTPVITKYTGLETAYINANLVLNSSSDQKFSPFIYNIRYYWEPVLDSITSSDIEITKWRKDTLKLSLDTEPTNRNIDFILDDDTHITTLDGKFNRTIKLMYDTTELFIGQTNTPEKQDPKAWELSCSAQDLWKKLENTQIRNNWIIDGLNHVDVIKKCLMLAGIPETMIYTLADAYTLPSSGRSDEPYIEFDAGKTVAEVIKYVSETFTGWTIGFQPVAGIFKFVYVPLEHYPTTPVKYFYSSVGLHDEVEAKIEDTYYREEFKISYIEPEATYIRVIGIDEYGDYLIAEFCDADAENPTLAEELKPDNWVGERRYVGYQDNSLLTQDAVVEVCALLAERNTIRKKLVQFKADFNINVFPNYIVELQDVGKLRIKSVDIQFDSLNSSGDSITAVYVGEEYVAGVN